MAAGVIDQQTGDSIAAYAASKHDGISEKYTDMSDMSPEERNAHFERFTDDGAPGDTLDELLDAGIITQEQAEAIKGYLDNA